MNYKNFFSELQPIAGSSTRPQSAPSIIRIGSSPTAVVIKPEESDESTECDSSNDGGSIEATPKNPTISDTKNNSEEQECSAEEKSLYERWHRMIGIKGLK